MNWGRRESTICNSLIWLLLMPYVLLLHGFDCDSVFYITLIHIAVLVNSVTEIYVNEFSYCYSLFILVEIGVRYLFLMWYGQHQNGLKKAR